MSLSYRNNKKKKTDTYILIGDGFDELEVVYVLHKFRQAGLRIKSVSLFDKLVFSRQGVGLKADYELADRPFQSADNCLLILPTGGRNGEALRRDARVKSLLDLFKNGQGSLAVTDSKSDLANDLNNFMARPAFHPNSDQTLDEFVDMLAGQVV